MARYYPNLLHYESGLAKRHETNGTSTSLEGALLDLISAMEKTSKAACGRMTVCEHNDSHQEMQNLTIIQRSLANMAMELESACEERLSYYQG